MKYDTDHARFRDDIGAYLAGGLPDAERRAFEAHAGSCPDCAAALAAGAAEDAELRALFAGARPGEGLEDRLVGAFRHGEASSPSRLRIGFHPAIRRAAVGVAAALLLGGFGYVATQAADHGGLPTPWTFASSRVKAASNLRDIAQGIQVNANESKGNFPRTFFKQLAAKEITVDGQSAATPQDMAKRFNDAASAAWGETPLKDGSRDVLWARSFDSRSGEINAGQSISGQQRLPGAARDNGRSGGRGTAPTDQLDSVLLPADGATAGEGESGKNDAILGVKLSKNRAEGVAVQDPANAPGSSTSAGLGIAEVPRSGTYTLQLEPRPRAADARGFGGNVAGGAGVGLRDNVYRYSQTGVDKAKPAGAEPGAAVNGPAGQGPAVGQAPVAFDTLAFKPNDPTWEMKTGTVREENRQLAERLEEAKPQAQQMQQMQQQAKQQSRQPMPQLRQMEVDVKAVPEEAGKPLQRAGRVVNEFSKLAADPQAAPSGGGAAGAPDSPPAPAANAATAGRKIIRNGEMSFEVDSFDSSYLQIVKIAAEEGGFVATTDSEKLANGKVRGVVTVRVPPERLDTLVLKLRGLGELKSSKIAAQDITKQYTDLESQLKAARAMEERLLNLIKTGKGDIKDLVEAEKQLGTYREKIEHIEGEVRYYNNLVTLSTLNVTLTERDIRTAAMLSETEQVNMGVEAEDVEKARSAAIKAIEEAKGRIVESDLKKLEAGQFAGRVVADVPPDASGPLIDRLRQVGTVARLEVSRKQTAPEGTVAAPQGAAQPRVERRDSRFLISLYNLANVAPRQTNTIHLAAEDVEVAYRAILDQVKSAGGRVVTSQLNRPRPDQTTGTLTFEVPAEQADVLLGAVRSTGEVMRLDVNQNPDTQNVTQTKRGFAVQIVSTAAVAPRETTTLRIAARGVADAFNKLREAVRTTKGGRILSSQIAEQDPANVTGTLDVEVRRDEWPAVDAALREAGVVTSRNVARSSDAENTVDTKIRVQVTLADETLIPPRDTVTVQLAAPGVAARYGKLLEAAVAAGARVVQSQLNEHEQRNNVTATLLVDVRRDNRAAVDKAVAEAGDVVSRTVTRSNDAQNTLDDKVRISLTMVDADLLPPRETATLGLETGDVEKAKEAIETAALGLGGRVVDSTLSRETTGRVVGKVVADVPLARAMEMVSKTRDQGRVLFRREARNENVPAGTLSRYRVEVTLGNEDLIVESGQGLGSRIREGLRTSAAGLLWSVQLIVVGLFLVAPWALIVWLIWRGVRRSRKREPLSKAPVPA